MMLQMFNVCILPLLQISISRPSQKQLRKEATIICTQTYSITGGRASFVGIKMMVYFAICLNTIIHVVIFTCNS